MNKYTYNTIRNQRFNLSDPRDTPPDDEDGMQNKGL